MYIRTLFNHFIILGNEYNHYMVILVQNDENEITAAWGTLLKTLKMSVYYKVIPKDLEQILLLCL